MENGVRLPLGFVTRIRDRRFVEKMGPGKKIESYPLPMDQWDKLTFREMFCDAIARKVGIRADLAEGVLEVAKGRLGA